MKIRGGCHCGAIQWEAPPATERTRCNCSFCDRVGAEWAYCPPDDFKLLTAPERVSAYQFGTYGTVHYHCGNCGCATHELDPGAEAGAPEPRPKRFGYNLRMAQDFDRSGLPVRSLDGRSF